MADNQIVIACIMGYCAICAVIVALSPASTLVGPGALVGILAYLCIISFYLYCLVAIKALAPGREATYRKRFMGLLHHGTRPQALARMATLGLILPLFAGYVSVMKSLIAYAPPVHLDALYASIDAFIHAGVHPHQLLAPILLHPWAYQAMCILYAVIWTIISLAVPVNALFIEPNRRRSARVLLAYVLCWIIGGTIMAWLAYAVGPVYAERATGLTIYHDFIARLHDIGDSAFLSAVSIADSLWTLRQNNPVAPSGFGISAMPSLHVAMACLAALYARYSARWVRCLGYVYCVTILASSVATGWHYAIDGYVSIALTIALWKLAGWLTRNVPA